MDNIKDKLLKLKKTPVSKLRKIEKSLYQANIKSLDHLKRWMSLQGFSNYWIFNKLLGNLEEADFQMFKARGKTTGKNRWHWRVYYYPNKSIIITSELEQDPIGNNNSITESISRHIIKDVLFHDYKKNLLHIDLN